MTREELNRVLDLQNKAYGLLLWIDEQARHQADLLSDENVASWKSADSCELWVRRMIGIFPRDLRPEENDIVAFARLFSAFFTTSVHVEEKNESNWARTQGHHYDVWSRRKLVAGSPSLMHRTPAEKKRVRQKAEESARHLQLIALEELAIENDCDLSHEQLETLASRDDLQDALNVYSYAHELLRRSQFASQGAAVHSLWNSMDKKTREKLKAEKIWHDREKLIAAMKSIAK